MKKNHLKNLIFDLGNVVLNIEVGLTIQKFIDLVPHKADYIRQNTLKSSLFDEYEKGLIDDKSFRQRVREEFHSELTDNQIDTAWNALLLDFPLARIELLKILKSQYRIFLLSNTNQIHLEEVENILSKNTDYQSLSQLFEKTYYSHQMKKRKPEADIYEQVLYENGLRPDETAFLDDNHANIVASQALGIYSVHILPDSRTMLDVFEKDAEGFYYLNL